MNYLNKEENEDGANKYFLLCWKLKQFKPHHSGIVCNQHAENPYCYHAVTSCHENKKSSMPVIDPA